MLLAPTVATAQESWEPTAAEAEVLHEVRKNAEGVARTFVALFLENVWEPHVADDPATGLPRVRQALERLRPLPSSVLKATFQRVMAAEIEAAFGEQLSRR